MVSVAKQSRNAAATFPDLTRDRVAILLEAIVRRKVQNINAILIFTIIVKKL